MILDLSDTEADFLRRALLTEFDRLHDIRNGQFHTRLQISRATTDLLLLAEIKQKIESAPR